MSDRWFISYSRRDGEKFALDLADILAAGPPPILVWLDQRDLRPGEDWGEQIVEALQTCKGLLFVMTQDSVHPNSVCKDEWVRALKYKKPIIPLLNHREAELPFRLGSRQYIDFTDSQETALAKLRLHLTWLDSPAGQLQALKYRLRDAQRELRHAEPQQQQRIEDDITELEKQIAQQQAVVDNPEAAARQTQENIERGLERERQPAKPVSGISKSKFINPPPLIAPTYFQNRHLETQQIGDFLTDEALRLMVVVGRGGIGKTAMVCRLLRSLEGGKLPDNGGSLPVDGIVYLSNAREFHRATFPDIFSSLTKLLSDKSAARLEAAYKNPRASTRELVQALVEAFAQGLTVLLLDNLEDVVELQTGRIKDGELDEALKALLELPPHGIKVIITTRVAPTEFASVQPQLQRYLNLETGLASPYAENVLRAMDADGKVGLRDASEALLNDARERTRGYPRALEHLFGILAADRDTSLEEILDNTRQLLPDQVVNVLVGEAFSRLDLMAQQVMQALAIYRYPVPAAATDYLLQAYLPGANSASTLSRLVNMQFVRREKDRYYLHQVDREYALSRIPPGEPSDQQVEQPPFSRYALQHRAANWFQESRKPREEWRSLDDLAPQLSEYELRCDGEEYDSAAAVLLEIDLDYLLLWGHFRLVAELHERLQGKIGDPELIRVSVGNLGTAYYQMGQYQQATDCYEAALRMARERENRRSKGHWLIGLGNLYAALGQVERGINCYDQAIVIFHEMGDRQGEASGIGNLAIVYGDLGESGRAINYHQQAIAIYREIGDQANEARELSNLGNEYAKLNQIDEAWHCYQQSLAIAQEIGYRLIQACTHEGLGEICLDRGNWEAAAREFQQSIEISDEIGSPEDQMSGRMKLAKTYLYQGDLGLARQMAEGATQYDFPLGNACAWTVLGIVALRQGEGTVARQALTTALHHADGLLAQTPQLYNVLDAKGLALCGLVLCEGQQHLASAQEAFQAARAINSNPGTVARVLRLFEALIPADGDGSLAEVTPAQISGD